ncbi:MAG: RNA-binding transcriptional accessory protein [Calditrichaeota bacterium]|nr:RNA-binding transcriptional accessory protein [Calditrichota bacterium]RQW06060.1 MAG: RNA-binding transcriptional accessory protein [Calditrichota bacterium]
MTEKDFYQLIAQETSLKAFQVANTVELLDEGNTVPFIARYRKEATGKLDEEQIRAIEDRIRYLRALQERKETVLASIREQGKLTPELEEKINNSLKMQELEDLYLPYRPKKRTRATVAREKGLEPLADIILAQEFETGDPLEYAGKFIDEAKGVSNAEEALQGALDIIAEIISDDADIRRIIRDLTRNRGELVSQTRDPEKETEFELYYDFREPVKRIVPHRVLAINRGEREDILRVKIEVDERMMNDAIRPRYIRNSRSIFSSLVDSAIQDAYKRLIAPSIEREIRNELTEKAEDHAIGVFATNLKNLLLQPPIKGHVIMGIDPGYRTGCKVAVIDETGKYLEGETIYPHPPQNEVFQAKTVIRSLIDRHGVTLIAIGNGTASRETEVMVADLISEIKQAGGPDVYYMITSEAGASVYSASKVAQKEFPDLDASMRGNISIARRVLDPLAELVKIDPKSIGVGLYQHDVNQRKLEDSLNATVESAVNLVGVDLNTASASLLRYISGLSSRTAENIVKHREENGKFNRREQLNDVKGIGDIAFQQSAGFLRIPDGENPLDNTSIHPESYSATKILLDKFNISDKPADWKTLREKIKQTSIHLETLAEEIGIGEPTLEDILISLEKPGRDPREEMPQAILRSDVLTLDDLREGMVLKGTVRNVVDFGAFVDIGLKRDGLVHVSEMGEKYVRNPHKVVSVGDVITVKVIAVDLEKERVKLSMKK